MPSAIDSLETFISRAERDRKYAPNTASGIRAALNLFESAMNEEEKESLDVLKGRLDEIYNEVFRRKTNKMTSDSIRTYYNRVKRVINDHNNYNHDPDKYNKWSPQRKSFTPKATSTKKNRISTAEHSASHTGGQTAEAAIPVGSNDRFEITFESGQRALLILPSRRTESDMQKINKLVEFLEATTEVINENEQKGLS